MKDLDLCYLSAVEAVAAFKAHMLSPVELMRALIARAEAVEPVLGWCMTYPFNMLSRCPVMSVPSGFASNGVPTGIQIIGCTYDDISVFRAAAAYEREAGILDWQGTRPPL